MRIVRKKEELKSSIETAQREAKSSFENDRLIIEKYFDSCRHIEFQIFGDHEGNAMHLFERECTISTPLRVTPQPRQQQPMPQQKPTPDKNIEKGKSR